MCSGCSCGSCAWALCLLAWFLSDPVEQAGRKRRPLFFWCFLVLVLLLLRLGRRAAVDEHLRKGLCVCVGCGGVRRSWRDTSPKRSASLRCCVERITKTTSTRRRRSSEKRGRLAHESGRACMGCRLFALLATTPKRGRRKGTHTHSSMARRGHVPSSLRVRLSHTVNKERAPGHRRAAAGACQAKRKSREAKRYHNTNTKHPVLSSDLKKRKTQY